MQGRLGQLAVVMLRQDQHAHQITFASGAASRPARRRSPRADWRRGGSSTLRILCRGATIDASSSGVGVDRLALGLHDVGQARVAQLVQAQIAGDHRRQLERDLLEAGVDLARHLEPPSANVSLEAKVPCGQPSRAASICPV